MLVIDNSLTLVAIGDWNKFYTHPSWLAENVFSAKELQIGMRVGTSPDDIPELLITTQIGSVQAAQNRFTFICNRFDDAGFSEFSSVLTRFFAKAISPSVQAYGFNLKFIEANATGYARISESFADYDKLISAGAIIKSTTIVRQIIFKEYVYNLTFEATEQGLSISVNRHCNVHTSNDKVSLGDNAAQTFVTDTLELMKALGYQIEESEEEK